MQTSIAELLFIESSFSVSLLQLVLVRAGVTTLLPLGWSTPLTSLISMGPGGFATGLSRYVLDLYSFTVKASILPNIPVL